LQIQNEVVCKIASLQYIVKNKNLQNYLLLYKYTLKSFSRARKQELKNSRITRINIEILTFNKIFTVLKNISLAKKINHPL